MEITVSDYIGTMVRQKAVSSSSGPTVSPTVQGLALADNLSGPMAFQLHQS